MNRVIPNVRKLKGQLPWQLLLQRKVIRLHVTVLEIFGHVAGLRLGRREVGRSGKVGLVSILGTAETGGRVLGERAADALAGGLVHRQGGGVIVGAVVGQQSFASKTEEERITDAETT